MNDEMLVRHIHLVYNTVADPASWQYCLQEISIAINAKSGMIGTDDFQRKANVSSIRHGYSEDMIEAFAPFRDKDVWTHHLMELNSPSFITSDQVLPQKHYLASEVFDGFSRHFDLYHTIGIYIESFGNQALRMAFQRGKSQGSYGQQETDYLNRLLPHIKQALNLSRKMFDAATLMQLAEQTVGNIVSSVFLLDRCGTIIKMNSTAEQCLLNENWLQVSQNKLSFKKGVQNSTFFSAIASVTRAEAFQDMQATLPFLIELSDVFGSSSRLLEVSRFQTSVNSDLAGLLMLPADVLALVTIRNLSLSPTSISYRLKVLYQLSDSEVDIALKLAKGDTPKQIAEDRSRSIETIRTQIKQLMGKIRVRNNGSLLAKINQLAL